MSHVRKRLQARGAPKTYHVYVGKQPIKKKPFTGHHLMLASLGYDKGKNDAILYTVDPPPDTTDTLGLSFDHVVDLAKANVSDFDSSKYDSIEVSPEMEDEANESTNDEHHTEGHLKEHNETYKQIKALPHEKQEHAIHHKLTPKLDKPSPQTKHKMDDTAHRMGQSNLQLATNIANDPGMWTTQQSKWANRQLQDEDIKHGQAPRDNFYFGGFANTVHKLGSGLQTNVAGMLGQAETKVPIHKNIGEKCKGFLGKLGTTIETVGEHVITGAIEGARLTAVIGTKLLAERTRLDKEIKTLENTHFLEHGKLPNHQDNVTYRKLLSVRNRTKAILRNFCRLQPQITYLHAYLKLYLYM